MSRRLPALTLLTVLCLAATPFVAPMVLPGAGASAPYGSHVYEANPYVVSGAQSFPVYSGSTVAQSFLVNETYFLLNVTLLIRNLGTKVNVLNVSIHPNDPTFNVPLMSTTLAYSLQIGLTNTTGPSRVNFPFGLKPLLRAGASYWIVAQNTAQQASLGYEWYSTNGTTYPDGSAYIAAPAWAGLPVDLFFITFGQEYDANLTTVLMVSAAEAQPNAFVTFTVYFNNTGAHTAAKAWINDTLPAALTNVSLGFPGIQPVSAATFPRLTFVNVTNAPHSFTVTAQVAIGTSPGTVLTSTVSLAYVNVSGAVTQAATASASVRIGLVTKQLHLASAPGPAAFLTTAKPTSSTAQTTALGPGAAPWDVTLSPALAKPLHVIGATATLWLGTQMSPPQTYHLTLGLLDNGTSVASSSSTVQITSSGPQRYVFSFAVPSYTFAAGHTVALSLANLGSSSDTLIVSYNSTLNDSQVDVRTDTYVAIRPLGLSNQAGATTMWSSLDSLIVEANVSDPFGASRIRGAWVNITSPAGQSAAAGAMTAILADSGPIPAWKDFRFTLSPPLTPGRYRVVVNAMEDNGVQTLAEAFADVAEPAFTFTSTSSPDRAGAGQTVALSLWYNNTGTGPASWAWVNDTLPAGLSFVTSNRTVTAVSGSTYTWAIPAVSVGSHALEVTVLVTGNGAAWVPNRATLDSHDSSGHALPREWSNLSIFLNGPILALSVSSLPAGSVHANETVAYAVTLANTGATAGTIWVNTTLPSGFAYNATDAGTLGGAITVSGSAVHVVFTGLPANSTLRFHIAARTGPALVRNATYTAGVTAAYTTAAGVLMPPDAASLSLRAVSPWFPYGAIAFLQAQALAGSTAPAVISFENLGNENASRAWVNLTIDPRLGIRNASAPFTGGSGSAEFALTGVPLGPFRIFLNFSVSSTAPDRGSLTVLGTLDAHDGVGNPLPRTTLAQGTLFVSTAQVSIFTANTVVMEAGVPAGLVISLYNWGTDTASNAWLNLSLTTALVYVNDTASVPASGSGGVYSWHWKNLSPGSYSFKVYLEPRSTVVNGTSSDIGLHLDYEDSMSNPRPGVGDTVRVTVIAPDIRVSVDTPAQDAVSGDVLVYALHLQNAGLATAARVYLVDDVDSRLQVITYDANVKATQVNQTLNWTFTGLGPGATELVNLTVRVAGGVSGNSIIPTVFEITYTNSKDEVLGTVRSTPVTVTISADYSALLWIGGGAAVIVLLGVAFKQRRKVEIEEVFLVYRDGVLISHLSRTLLREKDEDVLSGMLTAVQEFVREAFQYGEHRDLHQLDFGDYRILIERGKYVFLAIVYSGRESISIHKKVRTVISRIETEFGPALENWDGDMEQVMGARDLIRDTLLGSSNHNHTPKQAPEIE